MRKVISQRLTFISKSLLWSVLLYVLSMAIINWDEVVRGFNSGMARSVAVYVTPSPVEGPVVNDAPDPCIRKDIQSTTGSILNTIKEVLSGVEKAVNIFS